MTSPLPSLLLLGSLLALGACGDDRSGSLTRDDGPTATATDASSPDYWPAEGWRTATPESQGFPSGAFATLADDAATALPYYTSLMVIRNGWVLHESYHPTDSEASDANTPHHVWSITKSVTSLTLGRAWTLGDLTDLDETADSVFPASVMDTLPTDDARRGITLRHALQMRSGLAWNEPAWLLNFTAMKDPLFRAYSGLDPACPTDAGILACSILNQPLAYAPGTTWNYNTYDTYLASAFFTGLTGQSLNQYAATHLFAPLGITFDVASDWPNVPDPVTFGGGLLNIRSRDLARLGMLALYDGRWQDQQLIAKDWIDLTTTAQGTGRVALFDVDGNPRALTADDPEVDIPYGLQWWRMTGPGLGGTPSLSARGLGGQMMHIFKDKELIILITCDSNVLSGREAAINDFLQTRILDKLTL
ncbi:MAG: 6-aminohexanoate-dimer hydrolase [Moraxellaceae bacterium]|jgi:CubicO group peptidase (beta-lactamase class C family)|nr:6-aminohexanoate-dimer hydrolase [Moraxellaceae bacterium]